MISEKIKHEIINALKPIAPDRVILFGSHAYGEPGSDSDIDLLVVLGRDALPEKYTDKLEMNRLVSKALLDLTKKISTDLIVLSRPEWKKFIQYGSSFSREVIDKGIRLI